MHYFGKQWWGDKISGRWIGKKIKSKNINLKDIFFESDLLYFKGLTIQIINKYFDEKNFILKNNFLYKLSPTKAEFLVLKNTLKHKKIKHLLSIPYFIKRVFSK